jgi:hypothetical protein
VRVFATLLALKNPGGFCADRVRSQKPGSGVCVRSQKPGSGGFCCLVLSQKPGSGVCADRVLSQKPGSGVSC